MKKVKLNLAKLSIPRKVTFGQGVKVKMNGNVNFTTPTPTLVELDAAFTALETAANNAVGGTHAQTEIMYAKERAFDIVMTGVGGYVERIANQSTDNASAIIASAGMEEKRQGSHDVPPIRVKKGPLPLSAFVYAKGPKGKVGYKFQLSPDPITPTSWTDAGQTSVCKLYVSEGLIFGKVFWFRVAIIKGTVMGAYSDPVSILIGM